MYTKLISDETLIARMLKNKQTKKTPLKLSTTKTQVDCSEFLFII